MGSHRTVDSTGRYTNLRPISMMKLLLVILLSVPGTAFVARPALQPATTSSRLYGWLDNMFKPVHGHPGQLREEDLDDLYKDQQKLLKSRKEHHVDKEHLHQKYGRKEGFIESFLHPVHGGGSATSSDLNDMWEAQQELLYKRREYGKNHQKLKSKYSNKSHEQLEAQRHTENVEWEKSHRRGDPKLLNQKEDDAMYVEDGPTNPFLNFKMPWGKNLKP